MRSWPLNQEDTFHIVPLGPASMRRAYPLAHAHDSKLELSQWLIFARAFIKLSPNRGGLIAIEDARGYIHGLYSYGLRLSLKHQKILRVSDVILCNLPGSHLGSVLVNSVQALADELEANTIILDWGDASHIQCPSVISHAGFDRLMDHSYIWTQTVLPKRAGIGPSLAI